MYQSDSAAMASRTSERLGHLKCLYGLMDELVEHSGGTHAISECSGRMDWHRRGVYFFYQAGEVRHDSGSGLRIVRVGTHALKAGSRSTLWGRLAQHRGSAASGGGNHRGSIFRLLVGTALIQRREFECATWGQRGSASSDVRLAEQALERQVSKVIGDMQVAWLAIDDDAAPTSLRGIIERNVIGLLSNAGKAPLDPPSPHWLGRSCPRERVGASGLWNQNHVDEGYDPTFLDLLEALVVGREAGS